MKRVAILGCGPAGLLAAHAAQLMHMESDTALFAIKQQSVIQGAQFIHEEIPGLDCGIPVPVMFLKCGTKEGYAEKVYGDALAPCSFDLLPEGEHQAWPMHEVYSTLWDLYSDGINDKRIYPHDIRPLEQEFDLVISTIPRMMLCLRRHSFASQKVYFRQRAALRTTGNFIEYNGDPDALHYRSSHLFGHESTEFGEYNNRASILAQLTEGIKPLSTSCTCHPKTLFVGRFGKWQKGVLVHHAFQEVANALQQL